MQREGREGVWYRIPLPITENLLSVIHGSLLKASEAKQNIVELNIQIFFLMWAKIMSWRTLRV